MEQENKEHNNVAIKQENKYNNEQDLELSYGSRQVQHAVRDLTEATKSWDNKIAELDRAIIRLQEENFLISKVPEGIKSNLEQLVPQISTSIMNTLEQKALASFNKAIEQCNSQISDLGKKVQNLKKEIEEASNKSFRKKIAGFFSLLFLTSLVVLGITYFIMQEFPRYISIDNTGNVHIERSSISLWENSHKPNIKSSNTKNRSPAQ